MSHDERRTVQERATWELQSLEQLCDQQLCESDYQRALPHFVYWVLRHDELEARYGHYDPERAPNAEHRQARSGLFIDVIERVALVIGRERACALFQCEYNAEYHAYMTMGPHRCPK